jgi:hypothetical protein
VDDDAIKIKIEQVITTNYNVQSNIKKLTSIFGISNGETLQLLIPQKERKTESIVFASCPFSAFYGYKLC